MKKQAWAAFWITGLIWGSSFLLIRIGVREFEPVELVFIRTAIAALGLAIVIWLRRVPVPTDWPTLRAMIVIGIGNVVAPFLIITWSELSIQSGLAAVLQSSAALITLVVAHFTFADERITPAKIVGLLVGFFGVVVLFSSELGGENRIEGMLGMVIASACYAVFTSYGRKIIQGNVAPIVMAGATMMVATIATAPLAFLSPGGFTAFDSVSSDALVSVLILGLLNTFVAYLFYYFVVRELGAARASMVTYIVPPVGVVLGALILKEEVGLALLLGGGMIFIGIAIVNLRLRRRVKPELLEPTR
jgi:drug/metabolite transporter (DMT)-like permease